MTHDVGACRLVSRSPGPRLLCDRGRDCDPGDGHRLDAFPWFLKRQPAIRHWVLLSALVASLASPLLAFGFIASGRSFINVPLLIAEDTALAPELPDEVNPSRNVQAAHGQSRVLDEPAPSVAPETFLPTHRTGPAKAEAVRDNVATAEPKSPTVDPATGYSRQANTGSAYPFRSALVAVLLMWLCGTLVVILGLFRGVLFLQPALPVGTGQFPMRNCVMPSTRPDGSWVRGVRPQLEFPAWRGHRWSPDCSGQSSSSREICWEQSEVTSCATFSCTKSLMSSVAITWSCCCKRSPRQLFGRFPFMHLLNRELETRARGNL